MTTPHVTNFDIVQADQFLDADGDPLGGISQGSGAPAGDPGDGPLVYMDTATGTLYGWDGAAWVAAGGSVDLSAYEGDVSLASEYATLTLLSPGGNGGIYVTTTASLASGFQGRNGIFGMNGEEGMTLSWNGPELQFNRDAGGTARLSADAVVAYGTDTVTLSNGPGGSIGIDGDGRITLTAPSSSGSIGMDEIGEATILSPVIDIHLKGSSSVFFANKSGVTPQIGFFGAGPVAKPTVTGSRGGNAALASLLTALANLGLITDSTS